MTERMKKIESIQGDTIKDVLRNLKKHGKCLLVRPTGFGKTKTSVDVAKKFKHAVFLYPFVKNGIDIEKYDMSDLDVHFYTYSKLRNLAKSENNFKRIFSKLNLKNTIFIMDEAHFVGAPGTGEVIEKLMEEICPKANFFGITATPTRTDKLEIKWHFFDGITAYEYGLSEAFEDELYTKPHYVYTRIDSGYEDRLEKSYLKKIEDMGYSKEKKTQLKNRVKETFKAEKCNIRNLDEIISNNLHKFQNENNYYKFILFFSTFNNMHVKRKEIVEAFNKVFPGYEVNVIIVSSESTQYRKNLHKIDRLTMRENAIDLIFNVNMLTFGYHVSDLTGIMMFRETISDIIYAQQIGRCLSVVNKNSSIIFDMVENLYKDSPTSAMPREIENKGDRITTINLLLPENDIVLDERTKELLEIDRLINNAITEQYEAEVVKAYKRGDVEIDYCLMKLQLHSQEDFMKILERYE